MDSQQASSLRDLYPDLTAEQLEEAEANLERFLAVMARLVERLRTEGFDLSAPDLTASDTEASIPHAKVDPTALNNSQP
jgi:hypothetical protein